MRVIIFSSVSSREMACDELPISKALHSNVYRHKPRLVFDQGCSDFSKLFILEDFDFVIHD